ncbi:tellurite resistance/C4-dicarboxylate transporter family protein [Streptomyces sp. H10-C2]|uniref:tellurite resistance/C4-dicarboxylate transporter family protein n=1 Tax=unclassified Streptomyces TaxID=2593676 RepID=UPI0024B92A14|nr:MULTISPECIES: tellurite resistance/C4-dicarboxylate transporter family protein [unclassified Streptomyces]MDJ0343917.1 tellurite resistance/C4-dicarboxylate transporter family protein [Streptomyces sp. PH10-H1]MDJ0373358.1 tellurite resistance/C4-dicarboxylate transporter family protein [Streptomyces sp. H10-C2]
MNPPPGHWWADLPPAAGAAVNATGIISIGLHQTGHDSLSLAALALTGLLWLLLAGDFAARLLGDRARFEAEADTPPALTAVAATTVLGVRLSLFGWQTVAAILLVLATVCWPGLMFTVVRHWQRRMPGAAFLVCVATQGLSVLAAVLAAGGRRDWLDWAALVCFFLGLLLYLDALLRFDFRQVATGAGDQWVAGGALAISALAGSKLTASPVWAGAAHTALRTATLGLLALALGWYAVLAVAEARWPRPHYDIRRWATVFPLGMTAAACLSTADATGIDWPHTVGQVLLWIAVAAWVLTAVGLGAARSDDLRP